MTERLPQGEKPSPADSRIWYSDLDILYLGFGNPDEDPDTSQPGALPFDATALEAGERRAKLMRDGEWHSL